MNAKNLMIMMFTSLWVMGFFGVLFEKIARPREIPIPGWLSRVLFLVRHRGVSKFFYYYQISIYTISALLLAGGFLGLFGNYTLIIVFRLYVITVAILALYSVIMILRYFRQRAHLRRITVESKEGDKGSKKNKTRKEITDKNIELRNFIN